MYKFYLVTALTVCGTSIASDLVPAPFDFEKMIALAQENGDKNLSSGWFDRQAFSGHLETSLDELTEVEKMMLTLAPHSLSFDDLYTVRLDSTIQDGHGNSLDTVSCNANYGKSIQESEEGNGKVVVPFFQAIPAFNVYNYTAITPEMAKICFYYAKSHLDDQDYTGLRMRHQALNVIESELPKSVPYQSKIDQREKALGQ